MWAVVLRKGLAIKEQATYETQTYYIKTSLGGYGLYYRTVMAELGIIYPGGRNLPYPIDVPSEKGKEVAAAFREAIQDTEYYKKYFDYDDTKVPIKVIQAYMAKACLCQLQNDNAPDKSLLIDIFLHDGEEKAAASRRETFQMFLDIAQQTQGHELTQESFRQLVYFQSAENGASYIPQNSVNNIYKRWRLYQAREYYSFALNAMWDYLCYWGLANQGDIRPIPLSSVWEHLNSTLDFSFLSKNASSSYKLTGESGFSTLLDLLQNVIGENGPGLAFDKSCNLQAPIQENYFISLLEIIGLTQK